MEIKNENYMEGCAKMSKLAINGGKPVGVVNVPKWPVFDQREIDAVTEVVNSGTWGLGGTKVPEFEEKFAAFCGAKYGITAVNGTVTLRLALEALGVGPGDEVIVPGLTFQATAASVLDVNAIPIIVDIDPNTFTIDPKAIEAAISIRTKCIIPVHLYGRVADMDAIMSIAKKYNLFVLEDCAHQHGSEWNGKKVGSIGNIGSFSLQSSKVITSGEGGIMTTSDDRLNDLLRSLKHIGLPIRPDAPCMQSGNYRLSEFQAAILIAQMSRLEEQVDLRDKNALYMENKLKDVEGIEVLYRSEKITKQSYYRWMLKYIPEKWEGVHRNRFMEALNAELDNSVLCGATYGALNNTILYKPRSKNTHKLSDEYWEMINPARFDLPVCRAVCEEQAFGFSHPVLLTDKAGCDNIVNAIIKIRENIDELIQYARNYKPESEE